MIPGPVLFLNTSLVDIQEGSQIAADICPVVDPCSSHSDSVNFRWNWGTLDRQKPPSAVTFILTPCPYSILLPPHPNFPRHAALVPVIPHLLPSVWYSLRLLFKHFTLLVSILIHVVARSEGPIESNIPFFWCVQKFLRYRVQKFLQEEDPTRRCPWSSASFTKILCSLHPHWFGSSWTSSSGYSTHSSGPVFLLSFSLDDLLLEGSWCYCFVLIIVSRKACIFV